MQHLLSLYIYIHTAPPLCTHSGNSTAVSTMMSQRMKDMTSPDIITVENIIGADESHDYYDTPAGDINHHYHELEKPWPGMLIIM